MKAKLKDICKVDWGNTKLTKKSYVSNGDYLGVSAAGCDGRMNYYDYEVGTCVISAIGANCGRMFYPDKNFVAIKNTITLKPKDNIVGKYLYYSLINNKIPRRGGGQPFISKNDTENYEIKICEKIKQEQVVSELDKINDAMENRKISIDFLNNFIESKFDQLYSKTNVLKKIGEIMDVRDGTHDSPKYLQNSDYVLITSKDIFDGTIKFDNVKFISENDFININKRSKVGLGDIIMPMIGTIGNPVIVKDENVKFAIKNVALFKNSKEILPEILLAFLKSSHFKHYSEIFNKGGIQKFLSLKDIRDMPIKKIDINEQEKFVNISKKAETIKLLLKQDIKDLESLLEVKMHEYFD